MTTEEETKDSGNEMPGCSSGYDHLSSALSATSTSMISLDDASADMSLAGDKKMPFQKCSEDSSSMLARMQNSPRKSNAPSVIAKNVPLSENKMDKIISKPKISSIGQNTVDLDDKDKC